MVCEEATREANNCKDWNEVLRGFRLRHGVKALKPLVILELSNDARRATVILEGSPSAEDKERLTKSITHINKECGLQ